MMVERCSEELRIEADAEANRYQEGFRYVVPDNVKVEEAVSIDQHVLGPDHDDPEQLHCVHEMVGRPGVYTLEVYIIDPTAVIEIEGYLFGLACALVQSEYTSEGDMVQSMVPRELATSLLCFAENQPRPALKISTIVDTNEGAVGEVFLIDAWVKNKKPYSYAEVENVVNGCSENDPDNVLIHEKIADVFLKQRMDRGDQSADISRGDSTYPRATKIVTGIMTWVNEAVATKCSQEMGWANVVIFRNFVEELNWRGDIVRQMRHGLIPLGHIAMKLGAYSRITRPAGELISLINIMNVLARVRGERLPFSAVDLERYATLIDAVQDEEVGSKRRDRLEEVLGLANESELDSLHKMQGKHLGDLIYVMLEEERGDQVLLTDLYNRLENDEKYELGIVLRLLSMSFDLGSEEEEYQNKLLDMVEKKNGLKNSAFAWLFPKYVDSSFFLREFEDKVMASLQVEVGGKMYMVCVDSIGKKAAKNNVKWKLCKQMLKSVKNGELSWEDLVSLRRKKGERG